MSDEFLVEFRIPPPLEGVYEGLDPALDDSLFPPTRAQDLLNVRVSGGQWATRAGIDDSGVTQAPGSGATRLFDVVYEADGSRFRVLGRGEDNAGKLYDLEQGVDSAYQSVTGGTGLGTTTSTQPYWNLAQVGDAGYLTDRFGPLRKYTPATGALASVTIPAAPSAAPRVKAWTYSTLDRWTGGGTFGWTESASGSFDIDSGSGFVVPPIGTNTARFRLTGGATLGQTITKDIAGEDLNSHQIGFYFWTADSIRKNVTFGFGLQQADEFAHHLSGPKIGEWFAHFIDVGLLPEINKKRFKVVRGLNNETFYLTELFLPGRLEGSYRWVYTHYNPTTGHESEPSAISNGSEPLDFTATGSSQADSQTVLSAFKKSCMLDFTSDSGVDAATTKIRIYRSGGVPELTVGPDGRAIWFRVGEISDVSNQLNGAHLVADTTLDVDSATGFAADDWIVIAKGTATEEYQKIVSIAANTLTVTPGLLNNQSDNATVQIAFLDNVGNEAIDVLNTIDLERDSPPSASHWIRRSPDGRLWAVRYSGAQTGVRVSNRATPQRPLDFECFPADVDPQTRSSPLQGWGFEIGGDTTGEEIIWGDFYRGLMHILTRNKMFRINALAQSDWGPNAIQKVLDVGCIGGETVVQHEGYLYWVAEGPRVVRWDGEGPVEVLSHQRVNERLETAMDTAGTMNSAFWFARANENVFGKYWTLFYHYSDTELGNIKRLDWNITQGCWEPWQAFESNGLAKAWNAAKVWDGSTDLNELVAVTYRGGIFAMETGSTDDGLAISFLLKTKRTPLSFVGEVREIFVRLSGVTDTLTLTVRAGGSDYGDTSGTYSVSLSGSGDRDIKVPVERTVRGRWVEIEMSGNASNRPAIREIVFWARPLRERASAQGS